MPKFKKNTGYAPFKMKGAPMQRNFGIGSPMRDVDPEDESETIIHTSGEVDPKTGEKVVDRSPPPSPVGPPSRDRLQLDVELMQQRRHAGAKSPGMVKLLKHEPSKDSPDYERWLKTYEKSKKKFLREQDVE